MASEPFTVERSTRGGMCQEGPCRSQLVIGSDGAWHYEAHDGEAEGRLTDEELSPLRDAVIATDLAASTAPSTHCAADSDGTSLSYAWTVGGERYEADSCEVAVDFDDPLVRELDALAERLTMDLHG